MQNNSGNLHQILLSRYFREELKQRIWGKACPRKGPQGPAPLQFFYLKIVSRPVVQGFGYRIFLWMI